MNTPKIVVVIPTFNEVNNLSILTKKIFSQGIPNLDILIVDDNSPDGTADIVESLKNDKIFIMKRDSMVRFFQITGTRLE